VGDAGAASITVGDAGAAGAWVATGCGVEVGAGGVLSVTETVEGVSVGDSDMAAGGWVATGCGVGVGVSVEHPTSNSTTRAKIAYFMTAFSPTCLLDRSAAGPEH